MQDPSEIIDNFAGKNIVIVGDLVADQFLNGTIERVSREAPVFILDHDSTDTLPGGAANAAANVASLGAKPLLIGLIGRDHNGSLLSASLDNSGVCPDYIIEDPEISTTTKIRVLAGQHYAPRQQVIRIDYKNRSEITESTRGKLHRNLTSAAETADGIIISDYNYGVADKELVALARNLAAERQIPLLIDSRFRLSAFPDATSATPNQEEVEQILGKDFTVENCAELRERLGYEALLVTCGNKGMLLCEREKRPVQIDPIGSLEPVDVTGAGDTVIAVYALGLAAGLSFERSARIANHAGGIVVMKKGTCSVSVEELVESLQIDDRTDFAH
jgi:D-glycero-beta-D-manno-heptose-7-phosphate kinase